MVVLYGSVLFVFIYLTCLTYRDRKRSHELKHRKIVEKRLLHEIALLKAEINHGKETKERQAAESADYDYRES